MASISYRPEIDGLRALAVIPVVLFHAGFTTFSGGFVGVDVFFVISGFLITSIILRELESGTFSLWSFYERRIRRIVPALGVVIVATLIAFSTKMIPSDFETVGYSAISATVFIANMYFMRQEGYFDAPIDTKPLLHTWSLAVEEQFYIILPLILMGVYFVYKGRKRRFLSILFFISLFASLALSLWITNLPQDAAPKTSFLPDSFWGNTTYSSANFYLFFTRAWELLIGSLLALFTASTKIRTNIKEIMSSGGIALIVFSVFFIKEGWPFPGYWALFPTVGAALIIAGNDSKNITRSGQILATKPCVWIGKISYSLYLWHWPIFTYAHYTSSDPLSTAESIGLIVLSILIAALSYYFIEQPVRKKRIFASQKHAFIAGISVLALLVIVSSGMIYDAKERQKAAGIIQQAFNESQVPHVRQESCFERPPKELQTNGLCFSGDLNKEKVSLFLWGDSHADSLMPLIEKIAKDTGIKAATYAHGKCPPVFGAYYEDKNQCEQTKSYVKSFIEKQRPDHVLLVSRWGANIAGPRHKKKTDIADLLKDNTLSSKTPDDAYRVFERNFASTLDFLNQNGSQIWILKQVPEQDYTPQKVLKRAMDNKSLSSLQAMPFSEHQKLQSRVHSIFGKLNQDNLNLLDPSLFLCPEEKECPFMHDNHFLYRDDDHLSPYGAYHIEPVLKPLIEQLKK